MLEEIKKTAYVFFAEGFEEIEAITPVDILRRAGVDVKMISISTELEVKGAHNIKLLCDFTLEAISSFDLPDAIIFPGGMPGATNLSKNPDLKKITIEAFNKNKLVCAICASPAIVFEAFGLLENRKWTCYPNMEKGVLENLQQSWKEDSIVVDSNLITSRGPGTGAEFSFAILAELGLKEKVKVLKEGMLFNHT